MMKTGCYELLTRRWRTNKYLYAIFRTPHHNRSIKTITQSPPSNENLLRYVQFIFHRLVVRYQIYSAKLKKNSDATKLKFEHRNTNFFIGLQFKIQAIISHVIQFINFTLIPHCNSLILAFFYTSPTYNVNYLNGLRSWV